MTRWIGWKTAKASRRSLSCRALSLIFWRKSYFHPKLRLSFHRQPYLFGKDFSYLADGLGIQDFLSFSVDSPFDYDEVMEVFATDVDADEKAEKALELLEDGEQTLILFKSEKSMKHFKDQVPADWQDRIAFEGERELSSIGSRIPDRSKCQVLCSYHLWEGLDIPQDALTRVIIYDLPLPPSDPLFDAKRKHAQDPFQEVDLPFMLLRLRQGAGRLIRTSDDYGTIHLLLEGNDQKLKSEIEGIFPVRIKNLN